MRLSDVVIAYIVIGAVMFGGGAIQYDEIGVANWFVDVDDGEIEQSQNTTDNAQNAEGSIKNIVGQFAGPLVMVWSLVSGFIAFINWPITVLVTNNAPPSIILLLGVPFTAAFYLALIRLVRTSA